MVEINFSNGCVVSQSSSQSNINPVTPEVECIKVPLPLAPPCGHFQVLHVEYQGVVYWSQDAALMVEDAHQQLLGLDIKIRGCSGDLEV